MQVAAFLSDLKSLSVCPHRAAVNLVSVHKDVKSRDRDLSTAQSNENSEAARRQSIDYDLQRADELMSLHQTVKMKHLDSGPDAELLEARRAVGRVLASLDRNR